MTANGTLHEQSDDAWKTDQNKEEMQRKAHLDASQGEEHGAGGVAHVGPQGQVSHDAEAAQDLARRDHLAVRDNADLNGRCA